MKDLVSILDPHFSLRSDQDFFSISKAGGSHVDPELYFQYAVPKNIDIMNNSYLKINVTWKLFFYCFN